MTSKIFEYLATGKPILALIKAGELMNLIQNFSSCSYIVAEPDLQETIRGIRECFRYCLSRIDLKERDKKFLRDFNRRELTRQLAEIILAMQ